MQDFTVSVAAIIGRPGEYRELRIDRPLPGTSVPLATVEEDPIEGDLRAESVVEGILVTGRVGGRARLTCARCLKGFSAPFALDLCELFSGPGHELPPEEDSYKVEGLQIDLEPMLRDAIALDLPLNPVCDEDCKGLCALCGQDLNSRACACTVEDVDPRWAALSQLRDRLEA